MSILKSLRTIALDIAKCEIYNRVKYAQLKLEAVPITHDNVCSFKVGDFVRDTCGKQFYMVIKPKTTNEEGILAILHISSMEWYYRLEYDPYLRDLARNWSDDPTECREKTGADNKVDGTANTNVVLQHIENLKTAKHDTFTHGPAPEHYFPAFDFVTSFEGNCYLPAVHELYNMLHDKILVNRLRELVLLCGYELDDEIYIWSSTENTNPPCYGEEAFSLLISPQSSAIVQSRSKSKSAYVIPFKKF